MNAPSRPIPERRGLAFLCALALLFVAGCQSFTVRMALKKGNQLYNEGKYQEALVEYERILALDPKNWDANYNTAGSWMGLYHPGSDHPEDLAALDKALRAFERCMQLEAPDDEHLTKVRNFYLGLLVAANRRPEAAHFLEGIVAENPGNVALVTQLAEMYAKQGDFTNALKYFERRTEIEPANKEAWYTVGVVCWDRSYNGGLLVSADERGQVIERGIAALNKALEIDPDYFEALSYLNLIYREKSKLMVVLGKYDEAQRTFRMAEDYTEKALEARKKQKAAAPSAPTGG